MFWDSNYYLPNKKKLTDVSDLTNININPCGGTILSTALQNIPKEWANNKENYDIYIFTDGEISDNHKDITNSLKHHIYKN